MSMGTLSLLMVGFWGLFQGVRPRFAVWCIRASDQRAGCMYRS